MRVGCDIDGTYLSGFRTEEKDFVFITGRKTEDWGDTVRQLGTEHPLYLRPPWFPGDSPHWKAAMIQWLRIEKFYEDETGQAEVIARRCPDCQVVLIKAGQIVIDDYRQYLDQQKKAA